MRTIKVNPIDQLSFRLVTRRMQRAFPGVSPYRFCSLKRLRSETASRL
jgi:hypothetical protein